MPLSQSDRLAISLKVIGIGQEINGVTQAQNQINAQAAQIQALDTANKNLFTPVNALVDAYHPE